jgi:MFS family permease
MTASGTLQPSERLGRSYHRLFGAAVVSNIGDGVGLVAYPWLASAVTRNPVLIAAIAVVQRLPWLLFTLPAGVLTDRHDRRALMAIANGGRAVITAFVALAVLWRESDLPGPDELDQVVSTDTFLYGCVILATVLLGVGEVLYDNCSQTLMPAIVHTDQLERANGRLWAGQEAANQFAGPPFGSLLLAVGFVVPFIVDSVSFAVSAALILTLKLAPRPAERVARQPWRREVAEGVRWLWRNELLRAMAIVLGLFNASASITFAIYVLFAQEVLGASTAGFAAIMMAGAAGAIAGGWTGGALSKRLGPGPSLVVALSGAALAEITIGLSSNVPVAAVLNFAGALLVVLWNVVTVSLRQAIIPDHLLGRVNSVYRFFAWGMMPIGAMIGGTIVAVTERVADRELALRMPWFVAGGLGLATLVWAAPRLTTARIQAARSAASPTVAERA